MKIGDTAIVKINHYNLQYKLYRGEVLLVKGSQDITVKLVDIEKIVTVGIESLFPLPYHLATKTRKAIKGKLHGIQQPNGMLWPPGVVFEFKRLLEDHDGYAKAEFIDFSSDTIIFGVDLSVDHDRTNIASMLMERLDAARIDN